MGLFANPSHVIGQLFHNNAVIGYIIQYRTTVMQAVFRGSHSVQLNFHACMLLSSLRISYSLCNKLEKRVNMATQTLSPLKHSHNTSLPSSPHKRAKAEDCDGGNNKENNEIHTHHQSNRHHPNDVGSVLRIAKMSENAITPTKGSELSAGYDLYR